MIIMDELEKFFEYSLSTAWDISTATFTAESSAAPPNSNIDDFYIYEGGDKVFVIADGNDTVYEYSTKSYASSRGLAVAGISAGQGTLSGGSITGTSLNVGGGSITSGSVTASGSISATSNFDNNGRFRGAKNNQQAEIATWNNVLGTSNKYIKIGGNTSTSSDRRESDSYRHPLTPGNNIIEIGARGSSITHIENLTELQEVTVNDNIIVYGNPKVEDTNPTATGTTIYSDTFTEASDTALGSHTSDSGHTYSTIFDDTGGNGPNLTVFGGAGQAGMDQSVDNEGQTFVSSAVTSGVDYELIWNYQVDLAGINGSDLIHFAFGVVDSNNYFLLSAAWNSSGAPNNNASLIKVVNGAGSEIVSDPFSYHSLTISSNTAYEIKIKLVDRQHYIYHDNTLIWSGYLSGFPYDTDHGAGIGIGDRVYSGGKESHINYKFNSVTQKEYQASDFTYPNSYIEQGNFGIGTTTPSEPLHVDGNVRIDGGVVILNSESPDSGNSSFTITRDLSNYNSRFVHAAVRIGQDAGKSFIPSAQKIIAIGNQALSGATGSYNTGLGFRAGRGISGQRNVTIGDFSSYVQGSGNAVNDSVFLGYQAGYAINDSSDHVMIGRDAGKEATTGAANILIGRDAGKGASGTSTFSNTVAVGYQALTALTTGDENTAVGHQAANALTTQRYNTVVGYQALKDHTGGESNTVFGARAGNNGTIGQDNTLIGTSAGRSANGDLGGSVFVGKEAGASFGDGYLSQEVVGVGKRALYDSDGRWNTAVGAYAGENASGGNNGGLAAFGSHAGQYAKSDGNTLLGGFAGRGVSGSSTFSNTVAVGYQALTALTTGSGNTAVGYQAGDVITTGSNNTLIGHETGGAISTGSRNIEIGKNFRVSNVSNRVSVGYEAGGGNESVCIGDRAGKSATGTKLIAIGRQSVSSYSGVHAVAIGYEAGSVMGSGSHNTYIGFRQGRSTSGKSYNVSIGGFTHSNGDNNVIIGYQAGENLTTSSDGNVLLGYQAGNAETGSNKLYIENSNSTTPLIYGEFDNKKVKVHNSLEVGVRGDDTGNAGTLTINGDAQAGHDPKFIMDGGWHGSADKFEIEIGGYSNYGPSLKAHQMKIADNSGNNRITFSGTPSLGINYSGNVFNLGGGISGTGVNLRTAENLQTFQHTGFVYDWLEWTGNSSNTQGYDFHTYTHKNVLKLDGSNGQVSVKNKAFLVGTEVQNTGNGFNSVFEFGAGSHSNYHSHLIFRPTGNSTNYNANYWGSIGWDPSGSLQGLQINTGNYKENIWFTQGVPGASNPKAYARFDSNGNLKLHNTNLNNHTAPTEKLHVVGNVRVEGKVIADKIEVSDEGLTSAGHHGEGAEIWYQGTSTSVAGDVYYLNSSGDWANTDASAEATAKGLIAVAAGTDTDVNGMIMKGFVYLATDPGGSAGDVVYLSETANKLTTTAPTTSASIVRVCGYKVATNVVYFDPSKDFIELA